MVIIFTAIPYFMFYKLGNELLHWENNSNGIITFIFFAVCLIGFLSWIKLLDNQPTLIINKKGIWARKSILPFSQLKHYEWNTIKFVELSTYKSKNIKSTLLVIHKNDGLTKTIELDNVEYPIEEIITLVREHSNLLNYRDRLGS